MSGRTAGARRPVTLDSVRGVAYLIIVVGAGCSPRYGESTLDAPAYIMVGSTAAGSVTYEECEHQGIDAPCQSETVKLDSVRSPHPACSPSGPERRVPLHRAPPRHRHADRRGRLQQRL